MAWFKMWEDLSAHPKMKRFARRLGISQPAAVGHLYYLWVWAINYAPDGVLSSYSAEDIADAMRWEGDADEIMEALLTCGGEGRCGFLEKTETEEGVLCILHNWEERVGTTFRQRARNAEKVRRHRERQRNAKSPRECNGYVTVTQPLRNRGERRGEERKGEERKGEEILPLSSIEDNSVPAIAGTASTAQSETQKQPEESGETATQTATQKTAAILTQVIALWNAELGPLGFPRIAKRTPAREKAFHARLAEQADRYKLEWWQERISQLGASEFMRSSAREKANWLTFDWLLNENNLVKVQEGKYDSNRVTRPRSQPRMSLADMPDDIDAFEAALGIRRDGGNVITLDAVYRAKEGTQ